MRGSAAVPLARNAEEYAASVLGSSGPLSLLVSSVPFEVTYVISFQGTN